MTRVFYYALALAGFVFFSLMVLWVLSTVVWPGVW